VHRNDDTTTRFSPTGPGLVRQSHRLADFSGAPTFAQQSSDWAGPFPAITAQASALDVLTTQIPALAGPASP
jgi:hypothetical protein